MFLKQLTKISCFIMPAVFGLMLEGCVHNTVPHPTDCPTGTHAFLVPAGFGSLYQCIDTKKGTPCPEGSAYYYIPNEGFECKLKSTVDKKCRSSKTVTKKINNLTYTYCHKSPPPSIQKGTTEASSQTRKGRTTHSYSKPPAHSPSRNGRVSSDETKIQPPVQYSVAVDAGGAQAADATTTPLYTETEGVSPLTFYNKTTYEESHFNNPAVGVLLSVIISLQRAGSLVTGLDYEHTDVSQVANTTRVEKVTSFRTDLSGTRETKTNAELVRLGYRTPGFGPVAVEAGVGVGVTTNNVQDTLMTSTTDGLGTMQKIAGNSQTNFAWSFYTTMLISLTQHLQFFTTFQRLDLGNVENANNNIGQGGFSGNNPATYTGDRRTKLVENEVGFGAAVTF